MKRYKMRLPDTKVETFIKATKALIDSNIFPNLCDGCLSKSQATHGLPAFPQPWLHWFDDCEDDYFVYYGHEEDYEGDLWELFQLDCMNLGEL